MEQQEQLTTKKIIDMFQVEDGAINPKTGLTEKPSWYVRFEDMTDRVLFRSRLLTTIHGFQKNCREF